MVKVFTFFTNCQYNILHIYKLFVNFNYNLNFNFRMILSLTI